MSRTVASASWTPASDCRSRVRPGTTPRPACRRTSVTLARAECHAGAVPNASPVTTISAIAKPSTRTSIGTSETGSRFGGSHASIERTAHTAASRPSAPPLVLSSRLSDSNCTSTRARLAPSAVLRLGSRRRDIARARQRLATLAAAINSTQPTAQSRTSSVVLNCGLTNKSWNVTRRTHQSFISGYCPLIRAATPSISACACSRLAAGRSRPNARTT